MTGVVFYSTPPAPPSAPTITSLMSTYSYQITVTWTSVPTATSYNVSINDSVNTLVPIPSTRAPQYTFTGLTNNTVYTVSVVAINCAGSSSPATITGKTGINKIVFLEVKQFLRKFPHGYIIKCYKIALSMTPYILLFYHVKVSVMEL